MKSNHALDIAAKLTDVTKIYTIHHEKPTLVEKFIKRRDEEFIALNNINLTIYKGEKIGIIGPNGSGKTTLLKIIAGITAPSTGIVHTNGNIVSLIDLEAGFHQDLSGYQNIFLNGMILGMTRKEISQQLDSIIAFADIKQFIDAPLFTYSSGMKLRLGFSIVVHAQPDILIFDEMLSVGDTNFQKKSYKKIQQFFRENKTIILVSQWRYFIHRYCTKIISLKKGSIIHDGNKNLN